MTAQRRVVDIYRSDDGITMVELIVACAVLALLMAMVSTFFVIGSKVTAESDAVGQATGRVSNAMNEISRVVRSGADRAVIDESSALPPVISGSDQSLTLYTTIDSDSSAIAPTIVQFTLDGKRNLIEKRWKPTTAAGGYFTFPALSAPPTSKRVIPGPFNASAAEPPMFEFIDADGLIVERGGSEFSTDELLEIVAVRVTLGSSDALVLQNTVRFFTLVTTEGQS